MFTEETSLNSNEVMPEWKTFGIREALQPFTAIRKR